jgi:hypothetical protein
VASEATFPTYLELTLEPSLGDNMGAQTDKPQEGPPQALWPHVKYRSLVLLKKDFIVFIGDDLNLHFETTLEYDAGQDAQELKRHNAILNGAAVLEATPLTGLSEPARLDFKKMLGEAVACSFGRDYAGAKSMLAAAGRYLRDRCEETSRYWYLLASGWMTLPYLIIGLLVWFYRAPVATSLGSDSVWLVLACVAGAIGALLSVIGRSGRLRFDCTAGRRLHNLEGASRIWAGSISGVLAALAVKFGIILPTVGGEDQKVGFMIIAAIAAGSGERLATSIISKFDSSRVETSRPSNELEASDGKS